MDIEGFKSYLKNQYPFITDIEGSPEMWISNFFIKVHTSIPKWDIENAVSRYDMSSYVSGGKIFYGAGDATGETVYEPAAVGGQIIDRFYSDASGFGLRPNKSHEVCVLLKYAGDGIYRGVTSDDEWNLVLQMEFENNEVGKKFAVKEAHIMKYEIFEATHLTDGVTKFAFRKEGKKLLFDRKFIADSDLKDYELKSLDPADFGDVLDDFLIEYGEYSEKNTMLTDIQKEQEAINTRIRELNEKIKDLDVEKSVIMKGTSSALSRARSILIRLEAERLSKTMDGTEKCKMSFYDGTLDREKAIAILLSNERAGKRTVMYRYGFSYKGAEKRPIDAEDAIRKILNDSMTDVSADEAEIIINQYSSNDML